MPRQSPTDTPSPLTGEAIPEQLASRYTGFSVPYLRKARRHREGPPFVRIGRSVRYRIADLDAWLLAHRVSTREKVV